MSHLLEQLAEKNKDLPSPLTMDHHKKLGRVPGVISRGADDAFTGFMAAHTINSDDGKEVLRRLFGLLVSVTGPDRPPTRRRASAEEVTDAGTFVRDMAERLKEARLLVADEGTLKVAHEALLTSWDALSGWIEERNYDFALRDRLERDTSDWTARGCPSARIPPPALAREMREALLAIKRRPTGEQAAFLDPVQRASWLLRRDMDA